jgi:hypothetical protein
MMNLGQGRDVKLLAFHVVAFLQEDGRTSPKRRTILPRKSEKMSFLRSFILCQKEFVGLFLGFHPFD